jgi:GNAT superfamily N-acetyltransferase
MTIRLAEAKDKTRVLSLLNQLGKVINELVCFDPDNERAHVLGRDNYDRVMKDDNTKLFVIEDKGKVVGVASFFILHDMITGKPFAHIDDFVIDEKKRNKGYGTRLMKGILEYGKTHDIHCIQLTSSLQLVEAHKFYENLGGKFARKVIKFTL